MTMIPSFRNVQALTRKPSRRSAVSHRMVASEPVTDKFGPRSTPIRIAARHDLGDRRGVDRAARRSGPPADC